MARHGERVADPGGPGGHGAAGPAGGYPGGGAAYGADRRAGIFHVPAPGGAVLQHGNRGDRRREPDGAGDRHGAAAGGHDGGGAAAAGPHRRGGAATGRRPCIRRR